MSPSPYPRADAAKINFYKKLDEEKATMNLTGVNDMYKSFSKKPPANLNITNSSGSGRRKLMSTMSDGTVSRSFVNFASQVAESSAIEDFYHDNNRHLLGAQERVGRRQRRRVLLLQETRVLHHL